jgi:hypothetical protein
MKKFLEHSPEELTMIWADRIIAAQRVNDWETASYWAGYWSGFMSAAVPPKMLSQWVMINAWQKGYDDGKGDQLAIKEDAISGTEKLP